jgi:hypothetical protein
LYDGSIWLRDVGAANAATADFLFKLGAEGGTLF